VQYKTEQSNSSGKGDVENQRMLSPSKRLVRYYLNSAMLGPIAMKIEAFFIKKICTALYKSSLRVSFIIPLALAFNSTRTRSSAYNDVAQPPAPQ